MKVKEKGKWKSLPMSHNFFTGDMDQAVCGGIEELSDYTLVTKGKKSGKTIKKQLSAPKSSILTDRKRQSEDVESIEKIVPSKKSKNVFQVTDVLASEETNKSKNSGQVTDSVKLKEDNTKKKDKKKKKQNKPAINLELFDKIAPVKNIEIGETEKDVTSVTQNTTDDIKHDKELTDENVSENTKQDNKSKDENGAKATINKSKQQEAAVKKTSKIDTSEVSNDDEKEVLDPSELLEWKNLFVCDEILKALAEKGFKSPTPIQRMTLTASLKGKMDIVGAAETGSGKTLAFGIPIIQGIIEDRLYEKSHNLESDSQLVDDQVNEEVAAENSTVVDVVDNIDMDFDVVEDEDLKVNKKGDKLRALILTPTRELAMQIHTHLSNLTPHTGVGLAVVVGGMSVEKQLRLLSRGPPVVVATPGRLWDLIQEGNSHLTDLEHLSYLAIDETDRMVEKGHFEELHKLLEMVNTQKEEKKRRERQTFIMSATLSLVHKPPAHLKKQKVLTPQEKLAQLMEMVGVREDRKKVVDITRKLGTAETLSESVIHCSLTEKDYFLYYFLKSHPGRTVVFCNSIDCVRRLANLFSLVDTVPLPLHAQLQQRQRLKNMDRFSNNPRGLLIATDVAARGLDIPNIEHVVHYQVPRTSESYVHRAGRTARASKSGLSLLLVEPGEQGMFRKLCLTLARGGESTDTIPTFPVDSARLSIVKKRLSAARKLDKMLLDTRKKTVGENWWNKAAEEADIVVSDENDSDEEFYQGRLNKGSASKQTVATARQQLNNLLKEPLDSQVYSGAYPTMGGLLPNEVLVGRNDKAVEVLKENLKQTHDLLRGKKGNNKTKDKFKGFKKRRNQKQLEKE